RDAHAVPARSLPRSRSGAAAGSPQRRARDPLRARAARRDGDPRDDGPSDAGDVVAVNLPQPALFLDKDGTLLDDVPYNVDPARMRFARGAERALERLARLGGPLFVVSNQPGVALGHFEAARL